ncbi:TPA: glycerophosphodiester phosphodiesterase [Candidatus Woesearchaeota archaeon]|nr:glycerophosphodiester phosphodiesterase [Candidatus Woesearchaeota archaeon]
MKHINRAQYNYSYELMAHRGDQDGCMENTLQSIKGALQDKDADIIEMDVRMTRDGEFFIFHDPLLQRLTHRRGLFVTKTAAKLKNIRLRNGEAIPTLDQVFKLVAKTKAKIHFDLKDYMVGFFDAKKFLGLIKKYKLEKRVIISSFNFRLIRKFNQLNPQLYLCLYSLLPLQRTIVRTKKYGAKAVGSLYLTKRFIEKAHAQRLKVICWNIGSEEKLKWLLKHKVDVLGTGSPDALKELLWYYMKEGEL